MPKKTRLTLDTNDYQAALRLVVEDRIQRAFISGVKLARATGVRPDYLRHCLRGIRPLSVTILTKLAPALGTTAEQLHREAKALCD